MRRNRSSTAGILDCLGLCCGVMEIENELQRAERDHLLGRHHSAEHHYEHAAVVSHEIGLHSMEDNLRHRAHEEHHHSDNICRIS